MNHLSETAELFRTATSALFLEANAKAKALPPNTVQVWPGGATFSTIQSAINSITNAGPDVQYQIAIGEGTYTERVTTQPYIMLVGAGQDKTTITYPGMENAYAGTIQALADCGISELSIVSTGGGWGTYSVGVLMLNPGKLHLSGVNITATDSGNAGNNVRGISNNTGAQTGTLIIGSCNISALSNDPTSTPIAIEGFNSGFNYFIELSSIESQGPGYGVVTAAMASAQLEDCTITGQIYALNNSDQGSPITATGCTINGPVSPGVVVNATATPSK